MNWEAISAIGESVGALAVIATLIYLAIQIRQNTESVRANAHQTWVTTVIAEQSAGLQIGSSKEIGAGLHDPISLTEDTWIPFANYCNLFILKAESAFYLSRTGSMDNAIAEKEMDRAAAFIGSKGPGQWWDAGARTQFTEEFVLELEKRLGKPSSFQVYDFTPGKGFHPFQGDLEKSANET